MLAAGRDVMKALIITTITIGILMITTVVVMVEPLSVPKQGQCPSGYRESGGYCAPIRRDAPQAIPKLPGKQCPSGYASGAHYCVEMRKPR